MGPSCRCWSTSLQTVAYAALVVVTLTVVLWRLYLPASIAGLRAGPSALSGDSAVPTTSVLVLDSWKLLPQVQAGCVANAERQARSVRSAVEFLDPAALASPLDQWERRDAFSLGNHFAP